MAYTLYTQSLGAIYANQQVVITNSTTNFPATILATATGGLVNTNGQATLDGSGNLSVYIDTSQTWTVTPTSRSTNTSLISIVYTGPYANFPLATKYPSGSNAIATDQSNKSYVTNGTSWAPVPGFTAGQVTAGTTTLDTSLGPLLWANRPAAGTVPTLTRAFFTDVGTNGSWWSTDGTYWVPEGPVVLLRASGTLATPLATLTGATSGTFATPGSVPAGMFIKPGMRLEILANFARSTATATATIAANLGGTAVVAFTVPATANSHLRMVSNLWCQSASAQNSENWAAPNSNNNSSLSDKAIAFGSAQALAYSMGSGNAADSFSLIAYALVLYP